MEKERQPVSLDGLSLGKESGLEDKPNTSLVVSMFNASPETIKIIEKLFLPSVLRNASSKMQLVIVDDGSPLYRETKEVIDTFQNDLMAKMGDVVYFRNEENLGFAASYNKGMERADGKVLLVTNDDIYLPEGSVKSMINVLRLYSGAGAVGPVSNSTWTFQNTTLFGRIKDYSPQEFERIEAFAVWLRKVMVGKTQEITREKGDLSGFCFALDREVLEQTGYFDTRYKCGMFEDVDFFQRARDYGYRLIIDEATFVEHGGPEGSGVSLNQIPLRRTWAAILNGIKYANKWHRYLDFPRYLARARDQGSGLMTITGEIIREAKEKGLWEEYLKLQR